MTTKFRPYTSSPGFTDDFYKVRDFLVRINRHNAVTPGFLWGRWEWAFSLPYLDNASLSKIGVWEDSGRIVSLATYEGETGSAYFCVDPDYNALKEEMLLYAGNNLSRNGCLKVLIDDADRNFQRIARAHGFRPTQDKECTAAIDIDDNATRYALPEGFRVTSLADEYDLHKYNRVLWKGFNHGDTPPEDDSSIEDKRISLSGPHSDLNLKIAVAASNGEFVSYCGMWYEKGADDALVEPVATDPAYRKLGLGRAAVLEGVRRCGQLGAKRAFVGSSQQFYYNIGFAPHCTETFWEKVPTKIG